MAPLNLQNARLRATAGRISQFPSDPIPQVALAGRSNVGKSSLVNALLGRKGLARVSSTPGKTVTVNFYEVDGGLFLVDLPGYGFARRAAEDIRRWSALTDGYFTRNPRVGLLRAVAQLADCRLGLTDDDRRMVAYLRAAGIPLLVVLTKADKLPASVRAERAAAVAADPDLPEGTEVIPFSAVTREGRTEALRAIGRLSGARLI